MRCEQVNMSMSLHWEFRPHVCIRMPENWLFGLLRLTSPSLDLEGPEHSISQVSVFIRVRTGIHTYSNWSVNHRCCNPVHKAVSCDMCWFQLWHCSKMPLVRSEVCCRTSKANGIAFMRLADQPPDESISLPVQPLWQSNCEASSDAVEWWRAPVELRFNWVLQRHDCPRRGSTAAKQL